MRVLESKKVKIKAFGEWYEATVEIVEFPQTYMNKDILAIRVYHLKEKLKKTGDLFFEVECSDGHTSECYIGDIITLVEKEWHPAEIPAKVLVERTVHDAKADTTFKQTYIFNKSRAEVVFRETVPEINIFALRKHKLTRTLWLTANGGFVLETEYSSGGTKYHILDKSEAEDMVKERSMEKYIEVFCPQEI